MAPKVKTSDLKSKNSFSKMRVGRARHILSNAIGSALEMFCQQSSDPEFEATAFFLKIVDKWFYLVSARRSHEALGVLNRSTYEDNISFLKIVEQLFSSMRVGQKGEFKPFQKGIIISINSIIEMTQYLIEQKSYRYVLTGFFSQDVVENLISVLRSKQVVPNALQVKQNLKLVSVSQYMRDVKKSNYEFEENEFLLDFLSEKRKSQNKNSGNVIDLQSQYFSIVPD